MKTRKIAQITKIFNLANFCG